jgi:predicted permease
LFFLRLWLSRASYEAIAGDLCEEFQDGAHAPTWFWRQVFSTLRPSWRPGPDWTEIRTGAASGAPIFDAAARDVSYALRTLRKTPGFTVVAIGAIALGVGANTGIFTFLNALALRPLPVRDPAEIISIYQSIEGLKGRHVHGSDSLFSYSEYESYRDGAQSLDGLTAYAPLVEAALSGAQSGLLHGELVACNYFQILGRNPRIGRGFSDENCNSTGAAETVVLSDSLWRSKFGADPAILGKSITLSRHAFTVIGVAPAEFAGTFMVSSDFWTPLAAQPLMLPQIDWHDGNMSWLLLLGRLKPGVSASAARADLQRVAQRMDKSQVGRKTTLSVDPARLISEPQMRKQLFAASSVVLIGVSLVLLIACANVANLLLSRASHRRREITVRLSVGAGRGRIIRQLLTESLLISLAGGLLGTLVAHVIFRSVYKQFLTHLSARIPSLAVNLSLDWRLWAYSLALSMLTGIVFGLIPALESSKIDLSSGLKEESNVSQTRSRHFLRSLLMGGQVAICLILLISAGLLGRGLIAAQSMSPRFTTRNVASVTLDLRREGYTKVTAATFYDQLVSRLQANAGVSAVSLVRVVPLSGSRLGDVIQIDANGTPTPVFFNDVSPSFFRQLNIPIVRGRGFSPFEKDETHAVVIVTESTARRFWPEVDPIGKTIRFEGSVEEVIGVAKDVYTTNLSAQDVPFLYRPPQRGELTMSVLVSGLDERSVNRMLRAEIGALDSKLYCQIVTLEELRHFWTVPGRILTMLAGTLGLASLLLAISGVYGVVNYDANSRVREISVRVTLGATPYDVLRLLAVQCLRPILIGCIFGLAAAAAVTKIMAALLFGVSPLDPLTFISMGLVLIFAAIVAAYSPARQAVYIDPVAALRHQ